MLQPQAPVVPEPLRAFRVSDIEWLQTLYPWLEQQANWWLELRFTEDRSDGVKNPPVAVRYLRDGAEIAAHLRNHRTLAAQRADSLAQTGSGPWPAGLFWGIQPRVTQRGGREHAAALVALGASLDCDGRQPDWPAKQRPRVLWEALHVCPQPPSIVTWRGDGFDAWWLLREPLFDRRRGEELLNAIAGCLHAVPQDAGSLCRWPHTVNYWGTGRTPPCPVRVVWWQPQQRFSFEALREQFLPFVQLDHGRPSVDPSLTWKRFLRQLPQPLKTIWSTLPTAKLSPNDQHTLNVALASTLRLHELDWSDFEVIAPSAPWNAGRLPAMAELEKIWRDVQGAPQASAPQQAPAEVKPSVAETLPPAVELPGLLLSSLPESAWTEWACLYRSAVGASTEAADEFHYLALLTVLGSAFGRSVVLHSGRPLFLNIYAVLVGPTGDRKSTAAQLAVDLLPRAAPHALLLNGIGSQEGLMERMAAEDPSGHCCTLWFVDEIASLLKKARRESSGSLIEFITEIFHCPDFKTHSTRSKAIHLERPTLNILAGSTPAWLEGALQQEDVLGGFANRFVYVTGTPKADNPRPARPDSHALDELICWIRRATQQPQRELSWSDDAHELWCNFYVQWRSFINADEQTAALLRRIDLYVLKFAAMAAAMDGVAEISNKHLSPAIDLGRFLAGCAYRLLGNLGSSSDFRLESLIEQKLREAQGAVRRKQLRQMLGGRVTGEKLDRILTAMERNGLIQQLNETMSGRGSSRLVQLI